MSRFPPHNLLDLGLRIRWGQQQRQDPKARLGTDSNHKHATARVSSENVQDPGL